MLFLSRWLLSLFATVAACPAAETFLQRETFDDAALSARGWYDGIAFRIAVAPRHDARLPHAQKPWIDELVISRSRIGPLSGEQCSDHEVTKRPGPSPRVSGRIDSLAACRHLTGSSDQPVEPRPFLASVGSQWGPS